MAVTAMSTYSRMSSRNNRNNVASQSITRSNLLSLRAANLKENKGRRLIASLLQALSSTFSSLFAVPEKKTNSMCKYYGHVIRNNRWEGALPKCADCGCEISTPDQLRKSNTQAAR